jgi:hypothetical protein
MVALLPQRSASAAVRKLALRIDVSQQDEMKMMREWLQARGQQIPDPRAHHMMGATLMPGMLTPEEMTHLTAVTGTEFDRLFLEGMIKHHSGAITMVHDLFATDGAGQTPEIFSYASEWTPISAWKSIAWARCSGSFRNEIRYCHVSVSVDARAPRRDRRRRAAARRGPERSPRGSQGGPARRRGGRAKHEADLEPAEAGGFLRSRQAGRHADPAGARSEAAAARSERAR